MSTHHTPPIPPDDLVLDDLPASVLATMEVRDRLLESLPATNGGVQAVLADLLAWLPGDTIRVAFLGGNTLLHSEIENATGEITANCNVILDFGRDPVSGTYRTWSTADTTYSAEIRISFDMGGNFSLLGTDCINPIIGLPNDPVGGRPHQRTLNLGGFDIQKPTGWKGTVRHEFLHALAFHHEHQSANGPCQNEFRWDDDPGYVLTRNTSGVFVADMNGRRPGIYTYLSGAPNHWPRGKVDHNLRQLPPTNLTLSPFDPQSVMLYRFDSFFYMTSPSPCAPIGNGQSLSPLDIAGLLELYPFTQAEMDAVATKRQGTADSVLNAPDSAPQLKDAIQSQRDTVSR